jgi:hypothetical protein
MSERASRLASDLHGCTLRGASACMVSNMHATVTTQSRIGMTTLHLA